MLFLIAGQLIRENVKNASKKLDAALEGLSALRDLQADPEIALDDDALAGYIAAEKAYISENPQQERHRIRRDIKLRASYVRALKAFYALQ